MAVGLAIGAMYQLKCIHPPGGATALTAVMGGEAVAKLGYGFVLPAGDAERRHDYAVIAVAFNAMFPWRRYPAHLAGVDPLNHGAGGASANIGTRALARGDPHRHAAACTRSSTSRRTTSAISTDLRTNAPPPGEDTAIT